MPLKVPEDIANLKNTESSVFHTLNVTIYSTTIALK